jgi:hypothetical protein
MTAPLLPIAIARQYQDITEVFRARRIELGLSYAFIDAAAGFSEGHTEAMLGPSAKKGWGQATFFMLCEVLTVEFHAHVNMDAVKRMEGDWEKRRAAYVREPARMSIKLIENAKPHVFKASGAAGGHARSAMLTPKHRSEIARKAAKSRWRKQRKSVREAAIA